MIKQGDKVPVRLHTGKVVEAEYVGQKKVYGVKVKKTHSVRVLINGSWVKMSAGRFRPSRTAYGYRVRFVGPACILQPVERMI